MRKPANQKEHRGQGGSTAAPRQRCRNPLVLPLHRSPLLKLQAAGTIEQYWAAAQALTEASAPCSTRWFCVRPIGTVSALVLLRETSAKSGRARPARKEDEAAQLRDIFARHPAMRHFRRNARASLVHLNRETAVARSKSAQDWLQQRKWTYGVALAFWQRKRIEGFLLLHRSADEGDFSKEELASLRELHPHMETALCRLIAIREQQAQKASLASILRPLPLALVLCDSTLCIACESAAGLAARTRWDSGDRLAKAENPPTRRSLPDDLADFCRARIDAWERANPKQRARLEKEKCTFEHVSATAQRATVRMVRPIGFPLVRPNLLIQFDSAAAQGTGSSSAAVGKQKFHSLSLLSPRERELALLVCDGHGNERIARELGKSLHTIKAQLGSIFTKMQVKSRSELAARLTQTIHIAETGC